VGLPLALAFADAGCRVGIYDIDTESGATVLTSDPLVKDPNLVPLDQVVLRSDVLIVGAPHHAYSELDLNGREVVDIWGVTGRGIRL
jgi:UDP-N-acetyl-D-mannosaminuronate dehydrogenase